MSNSLVAYNNADSAYEYKVIEPVVGGAGPDATQIRKAYWNETGGTIAVNTLVTHSAGTAQGVGNSIAATAASANGAKVGVLTEATLDDNWGTVVVKGQVKVSATGTPSVGDLVTVSSGATGSVMTATVGTHYVIGHALTTKDSDGNVVIELY